MPSMTKKSSKAQSRLSISDQIQSPRPSHLNPTTNPEFEDEDLVSYLEEASSKFPSLIGKSALVARVIDVEADFKGCKIWLSESSMVASSLVPGAIVSVSLIAQRANFSNGFPLSSLGDESVRSFEVDTPDRLANEPGNYFALATIYPSVKVLKGGVRLSSNLSHTLGCPTSGRNLFVYPLRNQSNSGMVTGGKKQNGNEVDFFRTYNCKDLYLEFVSSAGRHTLNSNMLSSNNFHLEKSYGENEKVTSPKPVLHQSKLSSPSTRKLISPVSEESTFSSSNLKISSSDRSRIKEILEDKTAKKILETCSSSWLHSRCLLPGNLVVIPVLSELCTFCVVGATELSLDNANCDMNDKSHNYMHEAVELQELGNYALTISNQTRVLFHISSSTSLPTLMPNGISTSVDLGSKDHKVKGEISKLGGLSKEYSILKDIMDAAFVNTMSSFGFRTTKGVLLHGPPGTGKTSLARLCAYDAGVNFFSLNGPEIISQYYGESEQALNEVFESAMRAAPSVVFIDELDVIAPARNDGVESLSQRIVATLLNLMDGISKSEGFIVFAATNRLDTIESALRRPGRFDREIEIGVPSPKQRLDILLALLSKKEHSLLDSQVRHLAVVTHGFVGADLAALCNEAALVCLRRFDKSKRFGNDFCCGRTAGKGYRDNIVKDPDNLKNARDNSLECSVAGSSSSSHTIIPFDTAISFSPLTHLVADTGCRTRERCALQVTFEDFEKARMKVRPSAMREIMIEVPKVKWEDVGGQREVKRELMEVVEWSQKHQDAFERIGTRPLTGVLLFGPPGCSKTLMARAVASEAGQNFFAVKGPELFSKWVGESEKAVRSLFAKARANAPSIIFFDEIDGLAIIRGTESEGVSVSDRVVSQLLVEMNGLHERANVTVIAATNRPDKIDPALLRPGRFDLLLYVGPPNKIDREEIFCIHFRKIPCSTDVNVGELADLTKGYTGADISLICREAALAALEESLEASEVTMQQLKTAIELVKPSETDFYEKLSTKFQRHVVFNNMGSKVASEQCAAQSYQFSFWNLMKSVALFPYWFLGNIFHKFGSTK